ncbi:MAG: Gfo/Idh/MocA family oxidoreductase [Spirochaetaceae bacterium]|nr:Gfo/Idh/MocA family oxidoreductase [Spirochaetaceae bacterium]MDT8297689.1 Gfo/Idh/MocA family oxidoreductase [Spirochaetaceae bacterium]
MSNSDIRWGVIGAGDVVERKSGMPLKTLNGSSWTALMRRNLDEGRRIARRFGVPNVYGKVSQILEDPRVNAVYIATPPSSHASLAIQALGAGKSVYLEKPMALNADEARLIVDAVAETGGKLTVAHYRRALPAFLKVGELLSSGAVGTPLFARIRVLQPTVSSIAAAEADSWRLNPQVSGGGLFHDLSPHQLDLMLRWFGDMTEGSGRSACLLGGDVGDGAPDYVAGNMRLSTGVEFDGLWCFAVDSPDRSAEDCEIYGSTGRIRFSFFGEKIQLESSRNSEVFSFAKPEWIQESMIARTVDYFLGDGPNPCSAEDGLETMRMMDALSGRNTHKK